MRYLHALLMTPVLVTFIQAIVNMLLISCTDWTLLLYLNHLHLTTPTDLTFYFRVAAIPIFMPALANIPVAHLGNRIGHSRITLFGYLAVAAGYLFILLSSATRPALFVLGYSLYALTTTFRVIRLTVIADLVPPEYCTSVMALLQLMTVFGALLGPSLTYVVQTFRGQFTFAAGLFVVDRFTILYLICAVLALAVAALTAAKNHTFPPPAASNPPTVSLTSNPPPPDYGATAPSSPSSSTSSSSSSFSQTAAEITRFLFFTFAMTSARLLVVIMQATFQPALVTIFGATDKQVSRAYFVVAVTAVLPPMVVAALSRRLNDHAIIRIGLFLKICGLALYMPVLGPVREWQVVAGFVLVVKASTFFTTACISAFTKSYRGGKRAAMMGYLWSISNGVVATTQVLLGNWIVKLFGKVWYGVYGLPLLLTGVLLWHPRGWQLVNRDESAVLQSVDKAEKVKTVGVKVEAR